MTAQRGVIAAGASIHALDRNWVQALADAREALEFAGAPELATAVDRVESGVNDARAAFWRWYATEDAVLRVRIIGMFDMATARMRNSRECQDRSAHPRRDEGAHQLGRALPQGAGRRGGRAGPAQWRRHRGAADA